MNNIMLDLETFGTVPGTVIRSVGMVYFDPHTGEMGEEFYANITENDQLTKGCHKDPQTVAWWNKQGEAQEQLLINQRTFLDVCYAMAKFIGPVRQKRIWSQGSNFDGALGS